MQTIDGYAPRNYAMGYDRAKKAALWVAYPMHGYYTSGSAGSSSFTRDPDLPSEDQMGGTFATTYNRGHQLPNADRKVSSLANKQVYYYSNMTPQIASFNSPIWAALEGNVRTKWICSDTLYVVTGCHFDGSETTATDKSGQVCPVPTQYYKVLLRTHSGATGKTVADCTAAELKCIGFWYEHNTDSSQTPATCACTVADVEARTGLTFFVNVPSAPKRVMTPSDWGL